MKSRPRGQRARGQGDRSLIVESFWPRELSRTSSLADPIPPYSDAQGKLVRSGWNGRFAGLLSGTCHLREAYKQTRERTRFLRRLMLVWSSWIFFSSLTTRDLGDWGFGA